MKPLPKILVLLALGCATLSSSQTKVCWNDTVVLKLSGYKKGTIAWQESPDKSTWSNSHGSQSGDSLILLPPQSSLYYRGSVSNGTCQLVYSDTTSIVVRTDSCALPTLCTYRSTCNGNITDSRDNKMYKTIQIGTQCWMAENLNVGLQIPSSQKQMTGLDNQNVSIEKYCYADGAGYCTTYGGLYQWNEVMAYGAGKSDAPGPRGICAAGWHLPAEDEWKCLEATLGDTLTSGGKLKETTLWSSPNTGATNSTGFTALPNGYITGGKPYGIGGYGYWWSSAANGSGVRKLLNTSAQLYSNSLSTNNGFSVRCIKD